VTKKRQTEHDRPIKILSLGDFSKHEVAFNLLNGAQNILKTEFSVDTAEGFRKLFYQAHYIGRI
jgi:hypothetical protein